MKPAVLRIVLTMLLGLIIETPAAFSQEARAPKEFATCDHIPRQFSLPYTAYQPQMISLCDLCAKRKGPPAHWECGRFKARVSSAGSSPPAPSDGAFVTTRVEIGVSVASDLVNIPFTVQSPKIEKGDIISLFEYPYRMTAVWKELEGVHQRGGAAFELIENDPELSIPLRNRLTILNGGSFTKIATRDCSGYTLWDAKIISDGTTKFEYEFHSRYREGDNQRLVDMETEWKGSAGVGSLIKSPSFSLSYKNGVAKFVHEPDVYRVTHIQPPDPTRKIVGWVVLELISLHRPFASNQNEMYELARKFDEPPYTWLNALQWFLFLHGLPLALGVLWLSLVIVFFYRLYKYH